MPLSEETKKLLGRRLARKSPEEQKEFIGQLKAMGADFDIYEYAPMNLGDEIEAFKDNAADMLTFGINPVGEHPNAGDIKIPESVPYVGGTEVSPSAIAGQIAGAAPLAVAGGIVAGATAVPKVVRGVTAAHKLVTTNKKGRAASAAASAAEKGLTLSDDVTRAAAATAATPKVARVAGRATRIGLGEALPGFLDGYIRSDGDYDKAIGVAAEWMAGGLILEGTFSLIGKGLRAARVGETLTAPMRAAVEQFDGMVRNTAARSKKVMNRANSKLGDVYSGAIAPRLASLADLTAKGKRNRAEFFEQGRSIFEETMNKTSTFTEDGVRAATEAFNKFQRNMYGHIRTGNQTYKDVKSKYEEFFGSMNDSWENYNSVSPSTLRLNARSRRIETGLDVAKHEAQDFGDIPNRPIKHVNHIPHRPGADRTDELGAAIRDGEVLINERVLRQKFEEQAWLHPKVAGVDPLAEGQFSNYGDWEWFVVEHEYAHATTPKAKGLSEGAYENQINQLALEEVARQRGEMRKYVDSHDNDVFRNTLDDSFSSNKADPDTPKDPKGPTRNPEQANREGAKDAQLDYTPKRDEAGEWILKNDPDPISGIVTEVADDGFFTIQVQGGEEFIVHTSQVNGYKSYGGPPISGGSKAQPNSKPVSGSQRKELLRLHAEYTNAYGEAPRVFGKNPDGTAANPMEYIRSLISDTARARIRDL